MKSHCGFMFCPRYNFVLNSQSIYASNGINTPLPFQNQLETAHSDIRGSKNLKILSNYNSNNTFLTVSVVSYITRNFNTDIIWLYACLQIASTFLNVYMAIRKADL